MLANLLLFTLLALLAKCEIIYPNLTLPWGTWQATDYDENVDFFTFQNVRFGRPTNGTMRFKAPSYPDSIDNNSTIQDSSYGPICPQVNGSEPCSRPGGRIGAPNLPSSGPFPDMEESEDCLFLDIYVPSSALVPGTPQIPVVVWIYGGAYLGGSKYGGAAFNNGTGILEAAAAANQSKVIFITGNYRLGAFGWLAGSQMEKDATPNAGLYDQRLVLQWVQDYVHLIGGDKSRVSAWGESAGAGSILYHLISQDGPGPQDPLFSEAFLQSPAFQWQWDRNGTMDEMYKNFADNAGCEDHSIECLQKASTDILKEANLKLFTDTLPCTGLYPVGPALDGKLIKYLPPVAFDSGNYWKGIKSIIVSHVYDESSGFVPEFIKNSTDVENYIGDFFPQPQLRDLKNAVLEQYPADGSPYYGDARSRTEDVIRDLSFTCNTRLLYDAYHEKAETYMMQYNFLKGSEAAKHGGDLLPLFHNSEFDFIPVLQALYPGPPLPDWVWDLVRSGLELLAPPYQSYLASHAIHGDPNTGRRNGTPQWIPATNDSNNVQQVMEVGGEFSLDFFNSSFTDIINTNDACNFWKEAAHNITNAFPPTMHPLETPESQAVLHDDLK